MKKLSPGRIVALIILGVLALRSIDVRGIEADSDVGNVAGMMGRILIPVVFVVAMLGVIFWPRK
jgi:hypothetical protein